MRKRQLYVTLLLTPHPKQMWRDPTVRVKGPRMRVDKGTLEVPLQINFDEVLLSQIAARAVVDIPSPEPVVAKSA